jgi:hypothetical protein
MRPHYTPKLKKRTALLLELKKVFRRYRSQPIDRVISLINPKLQGWVNYFAVGHSSECFSYIKDWVEKKARRHLAQARKRKGFCWKRWNRSWLYEHSQAVQRLSSATRRTESCPSRIGPISLGVKQMGARSAGNPHAACDVEGTGDVARSRGLPARQSSTLPEILLLATIMRRGRTWPWTRMRPFLARFSGPVWSGRLPSWVDFITTVSGFRFSVHTPSSPWRNAETSQPIVSTTPARSLPRIAVRG